ncbi:DNA topoisomerase [Roseburia sp. MSJ-14]|uniref:DNA topoisomerase n=1 Tax=Roseburia sp. MSJ-14 TaxID=2841514 RepID=UPI001C1172F6|nr:DNA topoisomerase [Roseburia sp. MSJ-14]MBU5472623.1 type IA DNA topoisomerase [Roseburia sp. MSJ-14]
MAKALYIAEKPSVAREFAKALKLDLKNHDGYMESPEAIVTWCVGHLVTMSYPEVYDAKYKKWSLATLPFLPEEFKYEVIPGVKKQYDIVAGLLNRPDVATIYVCTDSGREGEYIYRLVERQAGVTGKDRRRVWIDSQTEEEILRGIREAKDLSEYDNLCESAYLRAKEDYLMGINFSRLLSLKYGNAISNFLNTKYTVVSVGRVMTCVLGMVVRREREIRDFVKTPFYRVLSNLDIQGHQVDGEWRAVEGSAYFQSPKLYKENGFLKEEDAKQLIEELKGTMPEGALKAVVVSMEKKKETKNPPLLYNLAELQNDCSRLFKISPDQTLQIVQELYEKKLVTYPRTDARVLSSAVAKEIHKNIGGLKNIPSVKTYAEAILEKGTYKNIAKTRYVNDKQITDHYAIIPTGQGFGAIRTLNQTALNVYETIVRRFLGIFCPPAIYQKISLVTGIGTEKFFSSFKVLAEPGYLKVMEYSFQKKKETDSTNSGNGETEESCDVSFMEVLSGLKKGMELGVKDLNIKEGETAPPKRYNSGSMILAMENAGQLIEDEELRAQIKGSGIGTSATRAEILKKLVNNKYLALNKKTQIITPTLLGEMIYDVVNASIRSLLNPELTASWEKGLNYVAEGSITPEEYMVKLENFIKSRTSGVLGLNNQYALRGYFQKAATYYKTPAKQTGKTKGKKQTKEQKEKEKEVASTT